MLLNLHSFPEFYDAKTIVYINYQRTMQKTKSSRFGIGSDYAHPTSEGRKKKLC